MTTMTDNSPEALVAGLRARLGVGLHVGQEWYQMYRKAVEATAKAHHVSVEEVEDAYISEGIEAARLYGEESEEERISREEGVTHA